MYFRYSLIIFFPSNFVAILSSLYITTWIVYLIIKLIHNLVFLYADYINEHKLAQDHPCVIKLIRQMYLKPPSPRDVPYNLTTLTPGYDPSTRIGIETEDLLLKNKVRSVIHLLLS